MRKDTLFLTALLTCASCFWSVVSSGSVFAGEPPCQDSVGATVLRSNIHVYHDQAEWNCCATIAFYLDAHADTFDLYESDTYEVGPCHCLCCFDLLTTITHVAPGEYLLRVLAAETGELYGQVWVEVPEIRPGVARPSVRLRTQGVEPAGRIQECAADLGGTLQSPCGGWGTDVEVAESTWGRIKTVFR